MILFELIKLLMENGEQNIIISKPNPPVLTQRSGGL
jgi:hypothetical protein